MYIYNITINIDESAHKKWLSWIHTHIAEVMDTGRFLSAKFTEVLVEEQLGGKTYSIQYTANTSTDLDDFYQYENARLQKKALEKFGDKMVTFSTELKVLKEFFSTAIRN